jgi:PadR family transcriptional regulator PadR
MPRKIVERSSQLLRGVLDMCLLAIIAEEPSYGYEMARKLEGRGLALVGEGSIYPLLSRLQRDGLVESFTRESTGGPPRKYYRIAAKGRQQLQSWIGEWQSLSGGVDAVINGGKA